MFTPRALLLISILMLICLGAVGADIALYGPDGTKLPDGTYAMHNGNTWTLLNVGGDVPNPPQPVPVDDLKKTIVAAVNKMPATEARHTEAMKLAAVFQLVGDKVNDGTLPATSAGQACTLLAKAALSRTSIDKLKAIADELDATGFKTMLDIAGGSYETWTPVLDLVESELSKQTGKAGVVSVLSTASAALISTVPDSEEALAELAGGGPLKADGAVMKLATKYGFDWESFLEVLLNFLMVLLPLIISYSKFVPLLLLVA